MTQSWRPDDWADDEREPWRGDVHPNAEPWRTASSDEAWRGDEHFAEWPEEAAGPEYRLLKGWIERQQGGD